MNNKSDNPYSHKSVLTSLSLMAEKFHGATPAQVERLQTLTAIITRGNAKLYPGTLSAELATRIVLYSPLHDVGKMLIPEMILKKTGALTEKEFDIMKTHTTKGVEYLNRAKIFSEPADLLVAIQIAGSHHEKYDGTGYPNGLKGDDIPLPARIMTVVDVYDALRSQRRYKPAYTHDEALKIILEGDGKTKPEHFDPRVLEVFSLSASEIQKLYAEK